MKPLPILWPWGLIYWAVAFWAMWPELALIRRSVKPSQATDSPDAGSLRVIMIGGMLGMWIAIGMIFVPALRFPVAMLPAVYTLSILALIASSLLRRHCFRQLGGNFTGDVKASADQTIVRTGAYSILRHPSYTAGILMNASLGLALGGWASTLLLIVVAFVVYGYRISVEERALTAAIGEPYREFCRTRRRLIPFVY
jgi:protein-S-isoprenylcysteine O-methyltransferase Ste14